MKKKITIDFTLWCTQAEKSKVLGIPLNTISQQLKRTKEGKTPNPIEYWDIPELNITLVRR